MTRIKRDVHELNYMGAMADLDSLVHLSVSSARSSSREASTTFSR